MANQMMSAVFRTVVPMCLVAGVTMGAPASAQTPAGGATEGATPAMTAAATVSAEEAAAARRPACERYMKVLCGQEKPEPALLKDRDFQVAAALAPTLTTCGAIVTDSDALCAALVQGRGQPGFADPRGRDKDIQSKSCQRMQFIFHELRAYPNGRSFLLPFTREECDSLKGQAPSCRAFVDAVRAGDASKCASTGSFEAICNAFIHVDDRMCGGGKGLPDDITLACREMVVQRRFLAKGLETVEKEGVPNERVVLEELGDAPTVREYVRAALGRPDACTTFVKGALDGCVSARPPAAPTTPVSATEPKAPKPPR